MILHNFIIFFNLLNFSLSTLVSTSSAECRERCTDRAMAFPLPRYSLVYADDSIDKECSFDCKRKACEDGCSELSTSMGACESKCVEKGSAIESCMQGCQALEDIFLSGVQELIDTVSVNIDMSDSGVHLTWTFPDTRSLQLSELATKGVKWFTHSRSATGMNDGWIWHELDSTSFTNSTLNASIILPAQSSPQLQVRLSLRWHDRIAVSRSISYQISARFLSPELALTASIQTSPNSYAICWRSNRIQSTFRVTLTTLDGHAISSEETTERCHQLRDLPRENCCRATVADVIKVKSTTTTTTTTVSSVEGEEEEESASANVTTTTITPIEEEIVDQFTVKIELVSVPVSAEMEDKLVFTNGSHILVLNSVDDYVIASNPSIIPFDLAEGDSITALAGVSGNSLVSGTEKGGLWMITLDANANENKEVSNDANETITTTSSPRILIVASPQKAIRDSDGTAIRHVAYDSMEESVYAVLSTKGLLRCSLRSSIPCTFYASDPINPIKSIAVDSWNGFLYMINSNKDVYQAELFPYNALDVYSFVSLKKVSSISPALLIEMNQEAQSLVAVLDNGTVVERDVITSSTRILRDGATLAKAKSFRISSGRLFWTKLKCGDTPLDEVCFYSEESTPETGGESHFSRYLYAGRIDDLAFLSPPRLPPLILAPNQIGLITFTNVARITWTPPQPLPFQAPGSLWRNIIYQVQLKQSNSTTVLTKRTDGTDLRVEITPGVSYEASVRACTMSVCSLYTKTLNTAFGKGTDPLAYIIKRSPKENMDFFDLIGRSISPDLSLQNVTIPKDIESALVFDNTTKSVFQSNDAPSGVTRQSVSSSTAVSAIFTKGLSVRHLALISSKATIIVAYNYHIVAYRFTGTVDYILHSCPQEFVSCPEVMAVAAEEETGDIYFLLHYSNSTVHLYEISHSTKLASFIAASTDFPQIRQLVIAKDRLIFVTRHGRMGFCDKQLGSLNINYALTEVALLLPIIHTNSSHAFNFTGQVSMSEKNKFELIWAVEPKVAPRSILYHVIVHKDKLTSVDSTHLFSLTSSITLPFALLESWSSGQHFEVTINANSAFDSCTINKTGLIAPTKPPSKPRKLYIYATQQKTVDGPRAIISLFWSPPSEWNGNAFQYIVNCTQQGGPSTGGIVPSSHLYYSFAVKSGKISCTVAAANEPKNVGETSDAAEIDSSELRPLVRLFAIDSTNSLISITNITAEMAAVRRRRQLSKIEYEALAFIGNDLFAEPDTTQILLVQIDTNQIENTVHKVSIGGDVSRIDAMTSDWVGHRLLFVSEFAWNQATSPRIYALTWNGMITIDTQARKCDELQIDWSKFGERGLKSISAFSIADKLFVFVTSSEMLIYGKDSIVPITIANPPLRQILAVSQSSQPFPDRSCFSLPASSSIEFKIVNEGRTGALLEVSRPPSHSSCEGISAPSTQYDVYFTRKGTDKVKHVRSFTETIHVENGILDKETAYEVTITWSNRYSPASGVSQPRSFRTGFGYPSPPADPFAVPISPDTLYLFWKLPETLNAPKKEIKYRISQQSLSSPSQIAVQEWADGGSFLPTTSDHTSCLANPCRVRVSNLRPSTDYKFWVTAIHESRLNSPFPGDSEAQSVDFSTRTKDVAGTLRPDNITGNSILLKWTSLQPEEPPSVVSIQYKESGGNGEWRSPPNATFGGTIPSLSILLNSLLAATSYSFRFVAVYSAKYSVFGQAFNYKEDYYQGVQLARTKAGTPTAPREVEAKVDEEGWIVQWNSPQSHGGSPITSYAVEVRVNESAEWEIAERGLDGWKLSWRPSKTDDADTFNWQFRVRAANQEGFGAYGYTNSAKLSASPGRPTKVEDDTVFILVIAVLLTTILGLCLFTLVFIRRRVRASNGKKKKLKVDTKSITLDKMVLSANSHTLPSQMQNELKNLPRISRNEVIISDPLGSGSFGTTYKGRVNDEQVAVKILRDDHSADDRIKFLYEAIIMNNFDHPNIVRLVGVCLEDDHPPYLIVEHMQGGDLRTFLIKSSVYFIIYFSPYKMQFSQNNVDELFTPNQRGLTLRELLSIMIDIARGCSYLEMNNHAHKDLAARNCLISSVEESSRITKLAHYGANKEFDVKKAQCECRHESRWMSPETLREGVFNAKTVVWSYGIVLYEILTMGKIPYEHVGDEKIRDVLLSGETLERPSYCPVKIFRVAESCWRINPDARPTFSELLPQLESFREIPEYQDDKPYVVGGVLPSGQADFDVSLESANSEEATMNGESQSITNLAGSSGAVSLSQSGSHGTSKKNSNRPSLRSLRKESMRPPPLEVDFPPLKSRPTSFYVHNSHPPSPRSPFSYSSDAFEMRAATTFGASTPMRSPRESSSVCPPPRISPGSFFTPPSRYLIFQVDSFTILDRQLHSTRKKMVFPLFLQSIIQLPSASLSQSWAPSVAASLPSLEMANKRSTQMGGRNRSGGLLTTVSTSANALNARRHAPSAPPPSTIGGVRKNSTAKNDNQPRESVMHLSFSIQMIAVILIISPIIESAKFCYSGRGATVPTKQCGTNIDFIICYIN
eukprot:PDM74903.1 rol-3 [Pristionchus pacificus]